VIWIAVWTLKQREASTQEGESRRKNLSKFDMLFSRKSFSKRFFRQKPVSKGFLAKVEVHLVHMFFLYKTYKYKVLKCKKVQKSSRDPYATMLLLHRSYLLIDRV